jgi:hypothetical protein
MPDGFTFWETIVINAIDKLALGLIVGLGALLGNRLLERYKARQAVWTALAQSHATHVDGVWQTLVDADRELRKAALHLFEYVRWGATLSPAKSGIPLRQQYRTDEERLELLRATPEALISAAPTDSLVQGCMDAARPVVHQKLGELDATIARERFWLGTLYPAVVAYADALHHDWVHLDTMPSMRSLVTYFARQLGETEDARQRLHQALGAIYRL